MNTYFLNSPQIAGRKTPPHPNDRGPSAKLSPPIDKVTHADRIAVGSFFFFLFRLTEKSRQSCQLIDM